MGERSVQDVGACVKVQPCAARRLVDSKLLVAGRQTSSQDIVNSDAASNNSTRLGDFFFAIGSFQNDWLRKFDGIFSKMQIFASKDVGFSP